MKESLYPHKEEHCKLLFEKTIKVNPDTERRISHLVKTTRENSDLTSVGSITRVKNATLTNYDCKTENYLFLDYTKV